MPPSVPLLIFVSMFAPAEQGGIRAFHLDPRSGVLVAAKETRGIPQPFFLALAADRKTLYSIWAEKFGGPDDEEVAAWRIVGRDGLLEPLNRRSARGTASCYLETDPTGRALLVANYTSGSVASLPIEADGSLGAAASFFQHEGKSVNAARQEGPHAHAIIPSPPVATAPGDRPTSRFAYAADLGTDQILCYRLDAATATLTRNDPPFTKSPPGAGPRHLRFHPNGRTLYVINELGNSVSVYGFDPASGGLTERQTITTLPAGFTGDTKTADLRITPDGRHLYGTNRGHDSIASFRIGDDGLLAPVEIVPSLGKGPQNLAITPDGSLLLCANMPGNNLAVFRIEPASGRLTPVGEPVAITAPACITIVP
ncbi:MAG: lactonase family protein [Planctomycetia bacterium]